MLPVCSAKDPREDKVIKLTSWMMKKHYCENNIAAVIPLMDDQFLWMGAADHEYRAGREETAAIFHQFAGKVPRCNITDEQYHVIQIAENVFVCTGRMWITTDPATQFFLRVHQRITTVFRWVGGQPRCCHIHVSNPYQEMDSDEVGFPARMAKESCRYVQEHLRKQTALLRRMSYEDSLTGLFNRNKFNEILSQQPEGDCSQLGVACFDLNGLKTLNDQLGHNAGDMLIRCTADLIRKFFDGRAFRTGGDEFVVVEEGMDQGAFQKEIALLHREMLESGVSCSVGVSWRDKGCSVGEQFKEADLLMYQDKRHFYGSEDEERRHRLFCRLPLSP